MKAKILRRQSSRRRMLAFVCLLLPIMGYSQSRIADSLKNLLPLKSGHERTDILYDLSYELVDVNYDSALMYARDAYKTALKTGDSLRIVKAGRIKALAFRRLEMLDSSLSLSMEMIPIARRRTFNYELKSLLNGIGLINVFKAEYDNALKYFFESLEMRRRDGDEFELSIATNNIGLVYFNLRDFDNALSYYNQSLRLKKAANSDYDMDLTLNNIALCYAYLSKTDSAYAYVDRGFTFCRNRCSERFTTNTYFTLGIVALAEENYVLAEAQFLKSYSFAVLSNNNRLQLDNLIVLMQIYLDTDRIEVAANCFGEAEKIINSNTAYQDGIIDALSKIIKVHERLGNFELMSFYQSKYITLKDRTYHDKLSKNLMRIEAEHIEKENKAKIEAQQKILSLNEEIIQRQKYLNLFIGIVAILLVLLTIILVRSNKQKQRLNQLLDRRVNERTQELQLNRDVLQRACDERDVLLQRIAADIRSSIATIKGLCTLAKKDVSQVDRYLDEVHAATDNFYSTAKKITYNKVPII